MSRQSNRTNQPQPQRQPAITDRPSNRTPDNNTTTTTPQVTITVNDGPAPTRTRGAGTYPVGTTVRLHSTTHGPADAITCTILTPDGNTTHTHVDTHGNTTYTTTQAGQHWYGFTAWDTHKHVVALAEAIFIVTPTHT